MMHRTKKADDIHEGKFIQSLEGHLEWINDKDLVKLNLWEGDKFFLHLIEKDVFFSGKFYYKNRQLADYSIVIHEI